MLRNFADILSRIPIALSSRLTKILSLHTLLTPYCLFGGRLELVISFCWQPEKEVKAVSSCQQSGEYSSTSICVCVHLNVSAYRRLKAEHMRNVK